MDDSPILRWLDEFALAVRRCDFVAGRGLFDPGVVGFGTFADQVCGLSSLEENQWRQIWSRTSDFVFDRDDMRIDSDGGLASVAVRWTSNGCDARGQAIVRRGRATIVLRRCSDGSWRAVHTHFSLNPSSLTSLAQTCSSTSVQLGDGAPR